MGKALEYRSWYRKNRIPTYYSGICHFIFSSIILLGSLGVALSQFNEVQFEEFFVVPWVLIGSNLFEYLFHRYPLHHPWPGLRWVYQIHTLEHHRFYDERHSSWESTKDFHTVFFPPWAPVLAVVIFWFLGHFLLRSWISRNTSLLFIATASAYFLLYEVLHFSHHFPGGEKVLGFKPLMEGRRHHRIHHDPTLMSRVNFNVTFPLFDWIFGTWITGKDEVERKILGD